MRETATVVKKSAMSRSAKYLEHAAQFLLDGLLLWYERNQALGELHGTALRLAESQVLTELTAQPSLTTTELASLHGLNQSSISRMLARLTRRGYLKGTRTDGGWQVTPKAKREMATISQAADSLLHSFASALSQKELFKLRDYCNQLADAFDLPFSPAHPGEHPLRAPQRRLARALHLLETKAPDDLPETIRSILFLLSRQLRPVSAGEILERLPIQRSAISVLLQQLLQQGNIRSAASLKDSRSDLIWLSAAGAELMEDLLSPMVREMQIAIRSFSTAELSEFCFLLRHFTEERPYSEFERRFKIQLITGAEELTAARVFYLELIAQQGPLSLVPEQLFDPKSRCFYLISKGENRGVLQLRDGNLELIMTNLPFAESIFERHFLETVCAREQIESVSFLGRTVRPSTELVQ